MLQILVLTACALVEARKSSGSSFIQTMALGSTSATTGQSSTTHRGRRLHIINQCQRPMVMHTTGSNSEIPCGETACPEGLTCNPANQLCYFDMPELSTGGNIPAGAVVQLFTPNDPVKQGNGVTADWSGKLEFYPDVSDGGLASSALCNGFEKCPTYQGLNGVVTAVEFTFVPHGADFYDVSIINGFNVGIEMKPDGSFRQVYEGLAASGRGYNCGAAGAAAQPDQRLSPCSWEFVKKLRRAEEIDDITPLLTQVDGGFGSCSHHSDCSGFGLVCGQVAKTIWDPVNQVSRPTTQITMECGHYIGSWSAYQLCVWSGNSYRSPPPYEGLIDCPSMHDMFACAGFQPWTTTCYGHNVPENGECCGCANWTSALKVPVPEGGSGCLGASPEWMQKALPFYQILKAGCPTSYTYAFDDETSTFTCRTAESQHDGSIPNRAGYNITLCPQAPDFQQMGAENQACRGSGPGDSKEDYYTLHNRVSLSGCKQICRDTPGCKGVEFGPYGRCEVWTREAGIQATATVEGYQCFRYVPFDFELVGEDEACRGITSEDSSSQYYRLHEANSSSCKELCRKASDVCKGIELGPFGRCELWTHVGGIHATKPVTGHSCLRFMPSDFELVGSGEAACRGDFWYDNSEAYFEHRKKQTLASCKELCRGMGSRCKGIEFGPYGRCELWTRPQGIQASRPLKGYSCYRYVPL